MAFGAYYIKAIALIKNKVLNYQDISYTCLDKLKDIISHLINQLNNYINIIMDIQKYKNNNKLNDNNFLLQQIFEKKNLMEDIFKNICENLNKINCFKRKYNDECFNNFNNFNNFYIMDGFDTRISDTMYYDKSEKHYNEDIIDYFLDYGLCEFFSIECKDKKCIIM